MTAELLLLAQAYGPAAAIAIAAIITLPRVVRYLYLALLTLICRDGLRTGRVALDIRGLVRLHPAGDDPTPDAATRPSTLGASMPVGWQQSGILRGLVARLNRLNRRGR